MSKENELLATFTKFMLEHDIECEEDFYQNEDIYRDSFKLIEDLFNIVDSNNARKDDKQTNADRIRNMSDEELTKILCLLLDCRKCPAFKSRNEESMCDANLFEWLQSEVE